MRALRDLRCSASFTTDAGEDCLANRALRCTMLELLTQDKPLRRPMQHAAPLLPLRWTFALQLQWCCNALVVYHRSSQRKQAD